MIKVLHMISGGDTGGAKTHIISLMKGLKDYSPKIICFIKDTFYEDLKSAGADIEVIEQKNRRDLSVVSRITEMINNEGFNILHCHGARANFISMFLRKKVNIPFITTIHSDYELDFKDSFYKKILFTNMNKLALKNFDCYITVSDDFNKMMRDRGFPEEKLFTVYNGIDTEIERHYITREEYLKKFNIENKYRTIFGISARLDLVKDHLTFLRAVEIANKKNPEILYLIAGDGNQREVLESFIREKNLSNVRMIGYERDIFSFYNAIDVNCLTSVSESFPYALLEGGILKKCVISTNVGGIPKLVDENTGFLFEVGDYERLSEIFLEIADNPEEIKRLGENIYEKIKSKFSVQSMGKSHIEIYEKVLAKKVLMLGYYGYDNSGDDAILGAIVSDLKIGDKNLKITALSKSPEKTAREYGIKSVNRFSILKVRRAMKDTDLFIFGGGTLLQDRTSTRSIRYYLFILNLAFRYKKKVMIYANGLGPIDRECNGKLAKKALDRADVITLRDKSSYELLKKLGVEKEAICLADPVFSLESENIPKKDKKTLAISVREWVNRDLIIRELRIFLDLMLKNTDWNILLFPMQYPEDLGISREIAEGFGDRVFLDNRNLSVREIINLLGTVDITVAMRLHALIYSAISKTPMIGLSYDPKINALMKEIGMKEPLDVENFTGDELYRDFLSISKNLEEIKGKLSEVLEDKKKMAKENAKIALELLKK